MLVGSRSIFALERFADGFEVVAMGPWGSH